MNSHLVWFMWFLTFAFCVCPHVENVLWEDRLQQGHVQQVDPSG